MVEYVATFTLWKPMDPSKASGVLIYAVPNRGNRLLFPAFHVGGDPGDGFFFNRGDSHPVERLAGRRRARPGAETITVPVAKNADGSSITGPVLARFATCRPGPGRSRCPRPTPRSILDTGPGHPDPPGRRGRGRHPDGAPATGPSPTAARPPSPARPTRRGFRVKGGFDPAYLYELVYTAKDPLVLGIGLAATRDIVSFFRYANGTTTARITPCGGRCPHVVAQGISQAGNFVRTFLHLGFNEDESGRVVWDGANAHIAARQLPINFRFAGPAAPPRMYEPGSEGVLWWGDYEDRARGRRRPACSPAAALRAPVPKVFETFGSAEFWGLRMSPNLVGTRADRDIPLPAERPPLLLPRHDPRRRAGRVQHRAPRRRTATSWRTTPTRRRETMRALLVALIDWVVNDTAPPPSRYPALRRGPAGPPRSPARWASQRIPGSPLPDNLLNPFLDYDFGPDFRANDLSGRMSLQPPVIRQMHPQPRPEGGRGRQRGRRRPVGPAPGRRWAPTWAGTSSRTGFYKGHNAGLRRGLHPVRPDQGGATPPGDPRPSLEERYRDHAGYVAAVKAAAERVGAASGSCSPTTRPGSSARPRRATSCASGGKE